MSDLFELFLRAALIDNLALSFFLGMCFFLGVSSRVDTALGFGLAVLVVQTLTVPLNHLLHVFLLQPGADKKHSISILLDSPSRVTHAGHIIGNEP